MPGPGDTSLPARMRTRLRQFLALPALERRTLGAALIGLPLCGLGLRLRGLGMAETLSTPHPGREPPSGALLDQARQIARGIAIAARHGPYRASCLERSLLLCRMLRRRGMPCALRIGAESVRGDLLAHAWVECNGVVLDDDPAVARRFVAFAPDSGSGGPPA